jgi:Carboxypeptidase regulatory-like domain
MKAIAILGLFVALSVVPSPAPAQGSAELRTVHGTVVDKGDNPIASAVVYLKNVRNLTVRTYISDRDGKYRFSGLDPNVDYELHAEHGDLTSRDHTVSSFDSRKEIVISLKVDRQKKKSNK